MNERNREFVRLLVDSEWNQSRAARELCLDTGTISRYVSGEIPPSMTVLKLFSEILREPIRIGDDSYTPSLRDDARPADAAESELLRLLRRLPLSKRHRLVAITSDLAALLEPTIWDADPKPRSTNPPPRSEGALMHDVPGAEARPSSSAMPTAADLANAQLKKDRADILAARSRKPPKPAANTPANQNTGPDSESPGSTSRP